MSRRKAWAYSIVGACIILFGGMYPDSLNYANGDYTTERIIAGLGRRFLACIGIVVIVWLVYWICTLATSIKAVGDAAKRQNKP